MLVLLLLHLAQAQGEKFAPWLGPVVLMLFGVIMGLELLNSAVELACDAITLERNPLIGKAKDMAAGGVLVMAVSAIILGLGLLGPLAIKVFFCEPYILENKSFAPGTALVLFYGLHHIFARKKVGGILALGALWAVGYLAFLSSWWVAITLVLCTALGLYGTRHRESLST